jgi:ketosteroid isomerase-like protein
MATLPHTSDDALVQLERQTVEAIQHRDAAAMAALLADEFVYRAVGAPDVPRAEFLRGVAAPGPTILRLWSDEVRVSRHGDTATISGVQRARVKLPDGKEADTASAFVDVCVWRGGRWQVALAFGVELPGK